MNMSSDASAVVPGAATPEWAELIIRLNDRVDGWRPATDVVTQPSQERDTDAIPGQKDLIREIFPRSSRGAYRYGRSPRR